MPSLKNNRFFTKKKKIGILKLTRIRKGMFVLTISSLWQHKTIGIGNFDQDRMPSLKKP
jgi:hypothetical protein